MIFGIVALVAIIGLIPASVAQDTIVVKRLPCDSVEAKQYDTNENNVIDPEELVEIIEDWLDDKISDEMFFRLLDCWATEKQLFVKITF